MGQTRGRMHQDHHRGLDLVLFAVGALRFAVESRHVTEVVDPSADLDPLSDPGRRRTTDEAPAMLSMTELLGIAPASGVAPDEGATPGPRERVLRLKRGSAPGPGQTARLSRSQEVSSQGLRPNEPTATWDIRIQEPISLVHASIDALYPMPALVTALCALPCLRGLVGLDATHADDFAILLDPGLIPRAAQEDPLNREQDTDQRMESADARTTRATLQPTSTV